MKPINVKAWAVWSKKYGFSCVRFKKEDADSNCYPPVGQRVYPCEIIIDPRHFDVVAKKKGKVKRGK